MITKTLEDVLDAHAAIATVPGSWACTCSPHLWREDAARTAHVAEYVRVWLEAQVLAHRDGFLASPNLDRAWISGWRAATDHIAHSVADIPPTKEPRHPGSPVAVLNALHASQGRNQ